MNLNANKNILIQVPAEYGYGLLRHFPWLSNVNVKYDFSFACPECFIFNLKNIIFSIYISFVFVFDIGKMYRNSNHQLKRNYIRKKYSKLSLEQNWKWHLHTDTHTSTISAALEMHFCFFWRNVHNSILFYWIVHYIFALVLSFIHFKVVLCKCFSFYCL